MGFLKHLWKVAWRTWLITASVSELVLYWASAANMLTFPPWLYIVAPLAFFPIAAYQVYAEQQQELASLQEQIKQLESSHPHINISFDDGAQHLQLRIPACPQQPDYSKELLLKKQELIAKYEEAHNPGKQPFMTNIDFSLMSMARGRNDDFMDELEEFLPKYESYLQEKYLFSIQESHLIPIAFVAFNAGPKSASQTEIQVDIPEFLRIAEGGQERWIYNRSEELFTSFYAPSPPREPSPYMDQLSAITREAVFGLDLVDRTTAEKPYLIEGRGSVTIVIFHLESLIPERPMTFGPIPVWFDNSQPGDVFRLPTRVYAPELAHLSEGSLSIHLAP